MDIFFIGHRDPIFSLIILFSIILMIAALSYAWGIFSSKDEKKRIEKFIRKFDSKDGISSEHKQMLQSPEIDAQSLCMLGQTFAKNGDFEKSISVYLIALGKVRDKNEKEFILNELGEVYFKAGFLKKASEVFEKVLELSPRNVLALRFLTMIDEKLKNYKEALYALNSLEELGVNVKDQKAYIKAISTLDDRNLSFNEKVEILSRLSQNFELLRRMILALFIRHNENLENLKDFARFEDVIDLLYNLKTPINLSDPKYKSLFYAKGDIDEPCEIYGFELNVIKKLKDAKFDAAGLSFNYVCKSCKNSFPMHFYRCPVCHELGSVKILSHITEKPSEDSNTF
ncbi:MAG: tetratricopeptide repeat protein [Campylobacter sp.]|nr:MAG: tetratricopeptide repeat protein [Campylobacter sp.]